MPYLKCAMANPLQQVPPRFVRHVLLRRLLLPRSAAARQLYLRQAHPATTLSGLQQVRPLLLGTHPAKTGLPAGGVLPLSQHQLHQLALQLRSHAADLAPSPLFCSALERLPAPVAHPHHQLQAPTGDTGMVPLAMQVCPADTLPVQTIATRQSTTLKPLQLLWQR